jgi:predicted hotdog family 3-hydroxylacyl-ACP dehydratase
MELPLDAEMLIPHRKPMRLMDRLNASDGKSASASARFLADCPFVIDRKGTIERLALLELIAQTYAASRGYEDLAEGVDFSQGYLVGISNAVYYSDAYVTQALLIKVESEEAFDKFHLAAGEVWRDDTLLMKATLKIWISSENTGQA